MNLPEGFHWDKRCHLSKAADGLFLGSEIVAALLDKVDGGWLALLDRQRSGVGEPLVKRECSSFEAGRRGVEIWATRHEARLRAEVAEKIASRPAPTWTTKG